MNFNFNYLSEIFNLTHSKFNPKFFDLSFNDTKLEKEYQLSLSKKDKNIKIIHWLMNFTFYIAHLAYLPTQLDHVSIFILLLTLIIMFIVDNFLTYLIFFRKPNDYINLYTSVKSIMVNSLTVAILFIVIITSTSEVDKIKNIYLFIAITYLNYILDLNSSIYLSLYNI